MPSARATLEYGEQSGHKADIKASIADLADLFDRFREQQTVHGGKVTADDKRKLRDKLNGLSLELDRYLARDYGIDPDKAKRIYRLARQPSALSLVRRVLRRDARGRV